MRYIANPVEVNAFKILGIEGAQGSPEGPTYKLVIGDDYQKRAVTTTAGMCARMTPEVGDYWVIQSDGYIYLNPKGVFERKYRPADPNALELGAEARRSGIA